MHTSLLSDEYRFIPAALIAGALAEIVAAVWPPRRGRVADAVAAFLTPALFFACYFVAIVLTSGLGWSLHLWLGAILLAGVIGLLLDELGQQVGSRS